MAESMATSAANATKISASCPICTNNFDEASETVALTCGHVFHSHCSAEWLKQSQTCPQCRKRLRSVQKDIMRIFLSFGDEDSSNGGSIGNGEEVPGLAELRAKLAAVTKEQEFAKNQVRRSKLRDAMMKRDLSQKQRQLDEFTTQLRTCQESLAVQEAENCQLMQLLAQEYEELSEEARRLQLQLDKERLERKNLDERLREVEALSADQRAENARLLDQLHDGQDDAMRLMESLDMEKSTSIQLTDRLLALEAESFQLSKRLNSCHAATSFLLLSPSGRQLTHLAGEETKKKDMELLFCSLPASPIVAASDEGDFKLQQPF